jgi:hypothetical protein
MSSLPVEQPIFQQTAGDNSENPEIGDFEPKFNQGKSAEWQPKFNCHPTFFSLWCCVGSTPGHPLPAESSHVSSAAAPSQPPKALGICHARRRKDKSLEKGKDGQKT